MSFVIWNKFVDSLVPIFEQRNLWPPTEFISRVFTTAFTVLYLCRFNLSRDRNGARKGEQHTVQPFNQPTIYRTSFGKNHDRHQDSSINQRFLIAWKEFWVSLCKRIEESGEVMYIFYTYMWKTYTRIFLCLS